MHSARSGGGIFVSVLSKGGVHLINALALVVLARLLVPGDFGVVAMVMAAVGFGHLFKDLGLSAATIRAPTLGQDQINSLFWINSGLGLAVGLAVYLAAPLVAAMYQDERLLDVTRVCALVFVVSGISAQPMALLRRHLRFSRVAAVTLVAAFAGQAAGVGAALAGAGYWSLVVAMLVTLLVTLLLALLLSGIRVDAPRLRGELRPLLHFGGHLVGFSILGFVALNAHNLILGLFHDAGSVGVYHAAFMILTLLFSQLAEPLGLVVTPVLSRLQDDVGAYTSHYLDSVALIAAYAAGLSAVLFACADDIVRLVLGAQWGESVPVLKLLALGLLPQALCNTAGWLYLSHGDTRAMMQWGLGGWGSLILLLLLAAPGGTTTMAAAYSLGMLLLLVPCVMLSTRCIALPTTRVLRAALPALLSALFALPALFAVSHWLASWPGAVRLGVSLLGFGTLYAGLLIVVFHQGRILRQLLPQLRARQPAGGAR